MIETGFELLDAIINNPIQAVLLLAIFYIAFKFLFGCHGFWADMRHSIKFELKYSIQRPVDRKIDNLFEWMERRDQAYNKWAETKTQKYWLKISIALLSCLLLPLLIWNLVFPSFLSDTDEINYLLVTILTIEYSVFVWLSFRKYEKRIKEKLNHE